MVKQFVSGSDVFCISMEIQHYFARTTLVRQEEARNISSSFRFLPLWLFDVALL